MHLQWPPSIINWLFYVCAPNALLGRLSNHVEGGDKNVTNLHICTTWNDLWFGCGDDVST